MQLKVERTIELTDLDDVIVNFFFFFLTGCYCNLLPLVGGFWVRIKRRIVYAKLYKRHLVCLSNISTTRLKRDSVRSLVLIFENKRTFRPFTSLATRRQQGPLIVSWAGLVQALWPINEVTPDSVITILKQMACDTSHRKE